MNSKGWSNFGRSQNIGTYQTPIKTAEDFCKTLAKGQGEAATKYCTTEISSHTLDTLLHYHTFRKPAGI